MAGRRLHGRAAPDRACLLAAALQCRIPVGRAGPARPGRAGGDFRSAGCGRSGACRLHRLADAGYLPAGRRDPRRGGDFRRPHQPQSLAVRTGLFGDRCGDGGRAGSDRRDGDQANAGVRTKPLSRFRRGRSRDSGGG